MYDLSWARRRVENLVKLSTRGQLVETEFSRFQQDFHRADEKTTIEEALALTLAKSQHNEAAKSLWNLAKPLYKRRHDPDYTRIVFQRLYLMAIRKGRDYFQPNLT